MTEADWIATERPALPPNAGIHSRRLDLELTRDELADTVDDLVVSLNPAVQVRSHPVVFGLVVAGVATALAAVVLLRKGRRHGRS